MSSSVGNHGEGAQTLHSGTGSQHINAGEGSLRVDNRRYYQFAVNTALENRLQLQRLMHQDGEDLFSMLNGSSNTSTTFEIADWLDNFSQVAFVERHRLLLSQRTPDTGEWLLSSEDFVDWQTGAGSWLWLNGIIGAGKSTLASIAVAHFEKPTQDERLSCCVYAYFQDDDDNGSHPTLESIYASLLGQLLRRLGPGHRVSELLQQRFSEPNSRNNPLSPGEYIDLLNAESSSFSTVFLVVDALENCRNEGDSKVQSRFLRGIRQLNHNWNVMITCRLGTIMGGKLDSDKEMAVEATPEDIKLYVEARITEDSDLSRLTWEGLDDDPAFMENICSVVITKAQGMFLLAKMHMDYLAEQHFLGDFRAALGELPDSRDKAFDAALQRIQRQGDFERRVAWHVLSWVAFSAQPVTVDEVRHAFAMERQTETLNDEYIPSRDLLTSSCAGVVVIDEESGQLRPIHDAVLKRIRESEHLPEDPHRDIATACLAYLSLGNFAVSAPSESDISELAEKYPLLQYAAKHWLLHLGRVKDSEAVEGRALTFLENRVCLSVAFKACNSSLGNGMSGLHACAYLGADGLAQKLLERGMDPDMRTEADQTPLHWAILHKKHGIAKLLLQQGVQANARDGHGNTAMHTLVSSFCDVKDMENQAAQVGVPDDVKNLVVLLVKHGADINLDDRKGWTSLRRAIIYGKISLVELLLNHGSDVNRRFEDGWTALGHAAQHGIKPLVLLLLNHKAEVNLRDREGDEGPTPLMRAIKQGHKSIADILLDHGADADATSDDRSTPLIEAVKEGREWAVWMLLRHGAWVDGHDVKGFTALAYAVKSGQRLIAWLLGEEGASTRWINKYEGKTPLHYAAERGDVSTAWYLIEKGALIDAAGFNGMQPLHFAAREGHAKLIDLFIDHGDDIVNGQDESQLTALHHAVSAQNLECASLLLKKGADPNIAGDTKATPLHYAAWCEDEEFTQVLLNAKADATIQDNEGRTALHCAVLEGNTSMTWRLAKVKECLDVRDKDGKTALIYAAEMGDELATLCLVKNGANTGVQDAKNWTAQDYAADKQHSLIVSLLQ